MNKALKDFLKFASFPIGILLFLGVFLAIWHLVGLPSFTEILEYSKNAYEVHGYWVVFLAALAEGTLLLNWYLPGSVVMVMGTVFAIDGSQSVFLTVVLINSGLFIMSVVNYWLGKYGWYKLLLKFGLRKEVEKVKGRILKHGVKYIMIGYFHPHIASLIATSAGILHMKFRRFLFYTVVAYVFWTSLWVAVTYVGGEQFLALVNFQNLLLLVGLWIVGMGVQYLWKMRQKRLGEVKVF
ncbi:DedA family protein [Candidatus Peregrinibacteria bacterium]|nr:DedA family protein [Candidatus Peregrinibacteria bacterium]